MKYERWLIPETDDAAVEALMDAGYPYLVSTVLASRGVVTPEQAAAHLDRERSLVYSPFLMRDMDKAVARIDRALTGGETIAVFGDYDVDGITSTCLLTDYLRSRGAAVLMHIPRRIEEGYGLGCDAIRALAEQGVTLIVTVDCGITGVEETTFAATLGVDLVITDHHECKDELPAACAVVDPHRPDCGFPFKHLAGVGVALELVLALGGAERENALFSRYCTLAAIGTIADVMRMEGENRTIVQCGLEGIDRSDFTGLHALLREAGLTGRPVSSVQIGFVLAPRINAAGRMGRAELAAELLLTQDPAKAERLARELCDLNRRMLHVGIPAALQSSMYGIANIVLQVGINMLGTDSMAGWTAFNKFDDYYWPISNAIGIAVMTYVGQNFGAGDRERVHESIHKGLLIHLTTSALFSVIIFSGRYPMMHLFVGDDPTVIAIGAQVTALIAPCYVLFTLVEVLSSTMRGVGDAVVPAAITMVFTCIVRLIYLWGYAFSHNSNLTIAVIYPISWVLTSIAFLLYYKSRKWMPKGFHF